MFQIAWNGEKMYKNENWKGTPQKVWDKSLKSKNLELSKMARKIVKIKFIIFVHPSTSGAKKLFVQMIKNNKFPYCLKLLL